MPKLPSKLKAEAAAKSVHICKACEGTGKNSQGGRCLPCNGKGMPYSWACISCNARHDGIYNHVCRNPACKLYGKFQ